MRKTHYIELYQQGGGFFSSLFGLFKKKQPGEEMNDQINGVGNTLGAGLAGTQPGSNAVDKTAKPPGTIAGLSTQQIGTIGTGLFSGLSNIQNAQNLPSQSLKAEAIADGTVNAVSDVASAFGPVGAAAGLGLKLINGIGGSLMNNNSTAKAAKDFKINDTIAKSSSYGGITAGAGVAMQDGQGYRKAGLFGKLFTNTSNLKDEFSTSNQLQSAGANVLNESNKALQGMAGSTDMFSNNMKQKNYNSGAWQNGSMTFGKKGMKLLPKAQEGIAISQSGSSPIRTTEEAFKRLGKAVHSMNIGRFKRYQNGGIMKRDHTEYKHDMVKEPDHGYSKWLQALPQRLQETNDYDLKGYFDKYGAVNVVGDQHLTDEFKKPNHVTFSSESIYNSPEHQGGEWRQKDGKWEFVASPWNIKNVGIDSLQTYFKQNEPGSNLILPMASHKEGGRINVIADGAFHSRKHSLKEIPELADANITLKGIPVVSEEKGGELTQHAEIEVDELILHYDLTKQLELLYEEGTDEAMIQAGRILSKEIVKNTKDSSSKLIKNG